MDPAWITAALALAAAVGGLAAWGIRWTWRILSRTTTFLDDYFGEPARDGVAARPGVMSRLQAVEDSLAHVVAETRPNHGNSLRDVVARTAQDVADMRGRMELFETQRAGREDWQR
jgi:hypothetical protein